MFVTKPELERWVPPGISEPGDKYWEAFMFVLDLPWYVLTIWHQEGTTRCGQTIAVATELTLRQLVEAAEPGCVAALSRVARSRETPGRWQMRDVAELWLPNEDEATDCGPLLFSLSGQGEIIDSHGNVVAAHATGRRLLTRLPS